MFSKKLAMIGFAIVLVVGCVPAHLSYSVWADARPPAPLVEVAPSAPGADYVWINGYWWWDGVTYVWVRGYWAPRPIDDYVWVASGWVVVDGRYRFVPGRWVAPSRRPSVTYTHPRPSVRVRSGATYRTVRPSGRTSVRTSPRRSGGRGR